MSARITPVGAEGAALLAALHVEAFPPGWPAAEFLKILALPGAFGVVVHAEEPVGMLAAWTAADEAEILTLAVTPAARRRGFARDLVNAAVAEAGRRGARAMFLEVAAGNQPARALYQGAGFKQTGRRRNYYRSPDGGAEDALVLRLELLPARAPLDLPLRRP